MQVQCTLADFPEVAQAATIWRRFSGTLRIQLDLFALFFRNHCPTFLVVVFTFYEFFFKPETSG